MKGGRLSGARWNRILDHARYFHDKYKPALVDALMADGFPPFSVPLSPAEQYMRLVAMRDAGDPRYWEDPDAIKTLARLEPRYGGMGPAVDPLGAGSYPGGGVM
jgi:hypothetical protein